MTATHCQCPCHHHNHAPTPPPTAGHDCGCGAPCGGTCHRCGGTPPGAHCPAPPMPCHEGTANLPPHDPPPTVGTDPEDVDAGRPEPGGPSEGPWFKGRVKGISDAGASFGPRKNEYLPYLVVRSNAGDRGARPVPGVFWESPDIFVRPGPAATAPLAAPPTAGVATVGQPTTIYAHVWNLGRAPVWGAYVEFSWFNPSLGFGYERANRLGAAMVDLGDRFTSLPNWREATGPDGGRYLTRGCHAIVRCPTTWVPTWENNGHECLVVRVFEPLMDPIDLTDYDARTNRHIGQRNLAVVPASSPAEIDLLLDVGPMRVPGQADVKVSVDQPASMPWLQLWAGAGQPVPATAPGAPTAGLLPPTLVGGRRLDLSGIDLAQRRDLLSYRERFHLGCDPVRIGFHAHADLDANQAHVIRVRQEVEGTLVGGFTVVLVKD